MYRGWTQTDYQKKHYNINQKDEGTQEDRGRDGGTNFILRIKEQETRLTLQEHDDVDDEFSFNIVGLLLAFVQLLGSNMNTVNHSHFKRCTKRLNFCCNTVLYLFTKCSFHFIPSIKQIPLFSRRFTCSSEHCCNFCANNLDYSNTLNMTEQVFKILERPTVIIGVSNNVYRKISR